MQTPIQSEIRSFVVENFLFGQGEQELDNDASFLESGIIDSTGVLELVGFLETKYGITVEDHELVPGNLDSLNFLLVFVERKLQQKGTSIAG